MKKSRAGRKPKNGLKAMSKAERQKEYRQRIKLKAIDAVKNIATASTPTLINVLSQEAQKIERGEIDDRSLMRKILVEFCHRYEIPVDYIEGEVDGLIDVTDDEAEEMAELHYAHQQNVCKQNAHNQLDQLRLLISMRQSELEAMTLQITSDCLGNSDENIQELKKACGCEELLLELLYRESREILYKLRGEQ